MNGEDKTKEQLSEELGKMRQRITELEALGTERMHLEEVLRGSEDKYRSLVKNIPDVTWTTDSRGNTIFISPNVEIVYGYTPEEIYKEGARLWFERVHPDDVERVKETYKALFEKGIMFNVEYRIERKDGKWIWLHDRAVATYEKDGVMYADGIFCDITERKKAEEELRSRTHDLGERVKELNCLYSVSQLVEKADISLEEIFQETVGLISYAWQYPEITCARIILEGQEFKTGNFRETIWKQASDIIVRGRPIGRLEVCYLEEKPESDEGPFLKEERSLLNAISERLGRVSERKQAEEALRESETKYREIAYNIPGIVYQFLRKKDGSLSIPFVSERCYEILGLKPEEIIEDSSLGLSMIMPEDLDRAKQKIARSVETMETFALEFQMRTKTGETKWLHATANPHLLPDDSILWNGVVIDISERRQMEETLQEYRKAVESSQEMIAVLDRQYVYCLANEAFLRYRDLNRDRVIGHAVAELLGEDVFQTKVKPSFDRCLGGENVRFEMVYETPQAGNRDLQVSYYPLRDDAEKVTGVVAILRDITLEKKIERKRECLIKLFQLLNKAVSLKETMQGAIHFLKDCSGCDSIGIRLREGDDFPYFQTEGFPEEFVRMGNSLCIRDGDGQIVRDDTGNPVWECMCGNIISGRFDPAKPFFTENGSFWTNSISKFLASTTEADRQLWMRNKCNVKGYESVAFVPLRTEIETFGLFQLNYRRKGQFVPFDITFLEMVGKYLATWLARKQAEKALRDSERNYRLLAENVQDIIWTTDMNFKFTYISPSVRRVRGYSVEEAMAQTLEERLTPASFEVVKKTLEEELAVEKMEQKDLFRSRTLEMELNRKDGSTIWTESTVSFLRDQEGRAVGLLGVTRDITERKKMEQEILKFSKLESVGILAGGIAHDFNNFLMAILGNISVAKMYTEPGDKIGERLTDAEKASMRAKDLTKQLLIFSHGGAPIKKIVSIVGLIKDSTLFALRGSNVRCQFSIPADLWLAEIDEGQISQVINNLIINADQAMPEGGIIEVCAENTPIDASYGLPLKEGEYIKISIKDQGVGIPEEHITKIFDPYFTTKQKGSGLGLATVYSIIKNHQGHITLESKIREGTTFYVYLPSFSKEFPIKKEEEEKIFAGSGKILVVDDEKMVRDVTGNMLKLIGYETEFAENGIEAIEVYKKAKESQQSFDAIILDLTIPGTMGGTETIKKLIEIDPEVKAVVSSGYSNDPVMANFREYGFSGFLVKPYKVEELNEILQKVTTGKNK